MGERVQSPPRDGAAPGAVRPALPAVSRRGAAVAVAGRRRRRRGRPVRRAARLPRRRGSCSSGSDAVDVLTGAGVWPPLRNTVTLAIAVSVTRRRRRHRPGLAHDPHRPAVPPRCGRSPRRCRSCTRASSAPPRCSPPSRRAGCSTASLPWVDQLPEVEGFGGSWYVLTLFTYPYVYLPVAARLGGAEPGPRGGRPPARASRRGRCSAPSCCRRRRARSGPARCSCSSTSCPTSAPSPSCATAPSPSRSTRTGCRTGRLVLGAAARRRRPASSSASSGPSVAGAPPSSRSRVEAAAAGAARPVAVAGVRRRRPRSSPTRCSARCRCSRSGRSRA